VVKADHLGPAVATAERERLTAELAAATAKLTRQRDAAAKAAARVEELRTQIEKFEIASAATETLKPE
jgi:hypothetical protein